MFELQKEEPGSASALITCVALVSGCAGILLATLGADNLFFIPGAIYTGAGIVCPAGWLLICRLNIPGKDPDRAHTH